MPEYTDSHFASIDEARRVHALDRAIRTCGLAIDNPTSEGILTRAYAFEEYLRNGRKDWVPPAAPGTND
jgi:hypothetical protein